MRAPTLSDVARELARPEAAARCACCGATGAAPSADLLGLPICPGCRHVWLASAERARANRSVAEFVERRQREIGRP